MPRLPTPPPPQPHTHPRTTSKLIPVPWLRLFSAREVSELLCGARTGAADVDVADLRRCTVYSGGYTPGNGVVKAFWKTVEGMDGGQRAALLRFVTGSSRPPLGGFKALHPPFTLHRVVSDASLLAALGGRDVSALPSASTCFNTLKLPDYRRPATLRRKLLYALQACAGFDLS